MSFNHFNRRLHLYLAMALLPWVFMYGISAIPFTRNAYFNDLYKDGIPQWTTRLEQPYDRAVPSEKTPETLQAFAKEVVQDLLPDDSRGAGAYSPNARQVNVYLVDFWHHTRIIYRVDKQTVKVEDKRFRWDQFFTTLHARGGYHHDRFLHDLWAFIVDLVCIGFILWVASGIVMWWQLKQTRRWGAIALGAGVVSFIAFVIAL